MTLALKFLDGSTGPYSGFEWPLPNGKPGKWVKATGKLEVCSNGIHACTVAQSYRWFTDDAYLIELGGRVIDSDDKLCARKGRLVRKLDWNPRLFAADCAEHVLPIFEKERPGDDRPRKAIEAARAYASGEIDDASRAAAWAAARDAAGAAAGAAAWDAAGAAAWAAAWDAAGAAAWDAAGAAAGAAAGDAEREWQTGVLLDHLGLTAQERKALA